MRIPARRSAVVALAGALLLGWGGEVRAAEPGDVRAQAEQRFASAEKAASELHFAEALDAYREAVAADPSAPFVQVARARISYLEAHAEGGFAPLRRLESVRRDPAKSGDRAEIEALARDIPSFPQGRVRTEAELVVAEAYWHRFDEPRRAIAPLERVIETDSADRMTRSLAMSEAVALHRQLDELDDAYALVERFPDLAPGTRAEVLKLVRRGKLRSIALVVLGLFVLIGLGSIVRAARRLGSIRDLPRRAVRPLAVAFSLYVGGAAAILVRIYGDGDPLPFVWLGFGVLGVDVIARVWRIGSGDRRAIARVGRALFCAVSVIAAAFLAVERTNAGYLESFGL